MSSAICFNLDQSKILSSGNGLKNKLCEEIILKVTTSICVELLYSTSQKKKKNPRAQGNGPPGKT